MKKFTKNERFSGRINGVVFRYIKDKGLSPQQIVDNWIKENVTLEKLVTFLKKGEKNEKSR